MLNFKTMEKIAEKQKTEKKEPIVLKDPAKSYHPEGNKTNLPITTTAPTTGGASLGVFGKNISQKVSESKESESKSNEESTKSETETDKKDEIEKTENNETEAKSSPEKAGEKVNLIPTQKFKIFVLEKKSICKSIGK